MTDVFTSAEIQRVIATLDRAKREQFLRVYSDIRTINDCAAALHGAFRPLRASQYTEAVAHFDSATKAMAERLVSEFRVSRV